MCNTKVFINLQVLTIQYQDVILGAILKSYGSFSEARLEEVWSCLSYFVKREDFKDC